jgi:hypothetical protein
LYSQPTCPLIDTDMLKYVPAAEAIVTTITE